MALPSNAHLIWHPFVGWCRHEYPPYPTIWNFIDFGVVNGATGLFAWPTAAFPYLPARKPHRGGILAMGVPMEGSGTDATLMVPHVPVPPAMSSMLPLLFLFGSSKIAMASSKTRIWCAGLLGITGELEQAVGCCVFPYVPLSLNMQCWGFKCKETTIEPPMPTDIVIAPNTVQVGVGFDDYLTVIMDWAIDVVLAVVRAYGPKLKKSKPPKALTGKALARATRAGDKAADKALKKGLAKGMKKEAAEASAAAARKAAYDHAGKSLTKIYAKAGAKVAFKVLKNTEWYRNAQDDVKDKTDDVKRGIQDRL